MSNFYKLCNKNKIRRATTRRMVTNVYKENNAVGELLSNKKEYFISPLHNFQTKT